jgi:hypothetical protein
MAWRVAGSAGEKRGRAQRGLKSITVHVAPSTTSLMYVFFSIFAPVFFKEAEQIWP